ncbi:hypothetical protein [Kitasatospora sp. NPDC088548]|uniref:hypothetical protein n=1 Tax=Kitasatospora sp. NPDC088548 TaxID=3364075 RepID=UPI00382CF627
MAIALDPHEVLAHWLDNKPYGERTRGDYERAILDWISHIGPAVWKPTTAKARAWASAPDALRTEAWRISVLRGFYGHARDEFDPTLVNPVPVGLRPAVDGLPPGRAPLTPAEVTIYISALDRYDGILPERARALGYLVLGMKLRAHQAVDLDLPELIREQHRVTAKVSLKGGGTELREVPPPVARAIREYLPHRIYAPPYSTEEAGPLITSGRGRRLDSHNTPRDILRAVAATDPLLDHLATTLTTDGLAASPSPFVT